MFTSTLQAQLDATTEALRVLRLKNTSDSPLMSQVGELHERIAEVARSSEPSRALEQLSDLIGRVRGGHIHLLAGAPVEGFDEATPAEVERAREHLRELLLLLAA